VDANASAWEILVSDLLSSKQRVNRWSPRSRHGVHLVLANPYAGEREEWYPNDCHSLIDARDHDEIVGGLRAEIERLTELLDRKSSVAYEDAQDRVAAETPREHPPELMAVVDKWQDYANSRRDGRLPRHSTDYQTINELLREIRCATVKTSGPLCPQCKTDLAFEGDVCGLCFPVAQP
jgi:hypothetical protein